MEAGNRKLYSKDLTSVALTSQHKRGIIGAYVEGKLKMFDRPKNIESSSSQKENKPTRGGGRGGNRGGNRGGRGRGGGRGGSRGGKQNSQPKKQNANPEQPPAKQGRDAPPATRGEQLPTRSKKKLVDRLKDPHVQAIIREQLEAGDCSLKIFLVSSLFSYFKVEITKKLTHLFR